MVFLKIIWIVLCLFKPDIMLNISLIEVGQGTIFIEYSLVWLKVVKLFFGDWVIFYAAEVDSVEKSLDNIQWAIIIVFHC